MSHTIQIAAIPAPAVLTIVNYVSGGETVSPLEVGAGPNFQGVVFGVCPSDKNSLGVNLFPVVVGGKVQLFQLSGGTFVQIPTTNSLNAVIVGFVFA